MAITKQAKNISVKVENKFQLFVGKKLEKTAKILNIEATDENLKLVSGKKITSKGKNA